MPIAPHCKLAGRLGVPPAMAKVASPKSRSSKRVVVDLDRDRLVAPLPLGCGCPTSPSPAAPARDAGQAVQHVDGDVAQGTAAAR